MSHLHFQSANEAVDKDWYRSHFIRIFLFLWCTVIEFNSYRMNARKLANFEELDDVADKILALAIRNNLDFDENFLH